jgi:hypothetical protein
VEVYQPTNTHTHTHTPSLIGRNDGSFAKLASYL